MTLIRNNASNTEVDLNSQFGLFETSHKPHLIENTLENLNQERSIYLLLSNKSVRFIEDSNQVFVLGYPLYNTDNKT